MGKTADPPVISRVLMTLPPVDRVAPQLACLGKSIRRHAGHHRRKSFLIKFKQFRMAPGVRAVKSDIDRDIADDPDSPAVRIVLQFLPLHMEQVLQEFIKPDLFVQRDSVPVHGGSLPEADLFRPQGEHVAVIIFLYRAKKRKIGKPSGIVPAEILERLSVGIVLPLFPFS